MSRFLLVGLLLLASAAALGQPSAGGENEFYRGRSLAEWIERVPVRPDDELRRPDVFPGRWDAVYALGRFGRDGSAAVDTLARVLENQYEHEYVRGAAAWSLGCIGPSAERTIPLLRAILGSEGSLSRHVSVRRNAARALGAMGPAAKSARDELTNLLDDEDMVARVYAAEALCRIERSPSAKSLLLDILRDGHPAHAYQAAVALGRLGPGAKDAVEPLVASLAAADEDLPRAASEALGLIGAAAIPAVKKLLDSESSEVRRRAVQTLGRLGPASCGPLEDSLQGDPDPTVRRAAARSLGNLGAAARPSSPALLRAVDDPDQQVREAAAKALRRIEQE